MMGGDVRTIGIEERRARLGARHALARRGADVRTVATSIVGFHSSDPTSVYLSAWARVRRFEVTDLERALYEDRSLVRVLGMRRTLFVIPDDLAAAVLTSCAKTYVRAERTRLVTMLADQGIARDAEAWLAGVGRRTLAALRRRGEATARELTAEVPELGEKLSFGEGTRWATTVGVSTRVLFLLATEGKIVRARPLGRWTSGQYRWAPLDRWLEGALPRIGVDDAASELLRRYLRAFGPATLDDIRWWAGWTVRRAASTLETLGAVEVGLDDGTGFVLPDDVRPVRRRAPWVALLPPLDPTVMGWKGRGWYLGGHGPSLFDGNGNAGPTVWADGAIVGGWAQAPDGEVRVELLEPVERSVRSAIERERARLQAWLGEVVIKPRFRTPTERALVG